MSRPPTIGRKPLGIADQSRPARKQSFLHALSFRSKPKPKDLNLDFDSNLRNSMQEQTTEGTATDENEEIASHPKLETISSSHEKEEDVDLDIATASESVDLGEKGKVENVADGETGGERRGEYIKGMRRVMMYLSLSLCLWMVNLEISIVSTSIVPITNDLGEFRKSSWILEAYYLTYIGLLVIWSKLSDIVGRKVTFCTSVAIFTIFSAACGGSQTMTQLIVFRAFKGIGAAGIFALAVLMMVESVPKEKVAPLSLFIVLAYAMSMMLGPILGGVINDGGRHNWRWVFLLNVPPGVLAFVGCIISIPNGYPYHGIDRGDEGKVSMKSFERVDWLGAFLLLAATIFICTGFEQAGIQYPWKSGFVISMLVMSGLLWILFMAWERYLAQKEGVREPVTPWRFAQDRAVMGMLFNSFLTGACFSVAIFQLPQRFQVVNGSSPIRSGVQLLPYCFMLPLGITLASAIGGLLKIPVVYMLIGSNFLLIIGNALLSTVDGIGGVTSKQLGFQVLAGLGAGISIGLIVVMTPFVVSLKDQSVALGAVAQFRMLGNSVALAVTSSVLSNYVKHHLSTFLSADQIQDILQTSQTIKNFEPVVQDRIKTVFVHGYNIQFRILIGVTVMQLVSCAMIWRKKNVTI